MSVEDLEAVEPGEEFHEAVRQGSSLDARMQQRATQLRRQNTEKFEIPGWGDLMKVELRSLGYREQRKLFSRNERIRDLATRELYQGADSLIAATIGFYEIIDGEDVEMPGETWASLAQHAGGAPDLTERQGFLLLVGDGRIVHLISDWDEWSKATVPELEEEVLEDFGSTG